MDKYLVPQQPSPANPKRTSRKRWNRELIELNGRMESKYRHSFSGLLTQSYFKIGAFPHLYHSGNAQCASHINRINAEYQVDFPISDQGISALDFDNKGIYLASVTKEGCLTVHDFETLFCQSYACSAEDESKRSAEDESKLVVHLPFNERLDNVRWNPANQEEVVCTSMTSDEVLVFDIGYISSKPSQVLRTRCSASWSLCKIHKGLSDVAFTLVDNSRLLASDTNGVVNVWDRRTSTLPHLELRTPTTWTLNSIVSDVENQIVFGASKDGFIYMWDLRGGRSSAFQSHSGFSHTTLRPLASFMLASLLQKISPLKAQSSIVPKEIHSIDLDPSCPYQLAFHLVDGWSGVLNLYNFQVTHIHCPPPVWLNEFYNPAGISNLRKPSWLPINSIYVVGSSSENGIHILDFFPDSSSPCHVDFNEDGHDLCEANNKTKQNRFLPLSEGVAVCAVHPFNATIVAGTKLSSLLMISQSQKPS